VKPGLFIYTILFILCLRGFASAETAIKAEVDRPKITTDEALTYKLVVTTTERKVSSPKLPKFENFTILSQANSSTVTFMQGGAKTILVFAFVLAPKTTGKLKIEPASVESEGKTYATPELEIEVAQGKKTKPETPPKKGKPTPPRNILPQTEPQYTL
jgi:hypothetical protein